MQAHVGDTIVVESEKIAQQERKGTIEEILEGTPSRFRVRWENGRESIFVPAAGSARVEPRPRAKRK